MNCNSWSAVDGLGRVLPMPEEVGAPRSRFVGMFYFGWHDLMSRMRPVNVNNLLEKYPEARFDFHNPVWTDPAVVGKGGQSSDLPYGDLIEDQIYFWNEPLFGFYKNTDEWVIRRHGEMLAAAGVDTIIFDSSNFTLIWEETFDAIAKVWSQMRREGTPTPSMSYLLNFWPGEYTRTDLQNIYRWFQEKPYAKEMWFNWKGKPLVMGYDSCLREEDGYLKEFFTFRPCQPSYFLGNERGAKWGWLSAYPQFAFPGEDGRIEQMTVGCSQNASVESARRKMPTAFSAFEQVFSRSYTHEHGYVPGGTLSGANFQEQWDRAREVDPEFVFVTSWNEWLAGRLEGWNNGETTYINAFVDTFNNDRSRDIEPTRGELKDNYYYQLVANIRAFKGAAPAKEADAPRAIRLGDWAQWDEVSDVYTSHPNHSIPRHEDGYAGHHYDNDSCRNELRVAKAARDDNSFYFYVEAAKPLTPNDNDLWMRLLLRTPGDKPHWEGFHYAVGIGGYGEKVGLYRCRGGWDWERIGECDWVADSCRLVVRVPREALGDPHMVDLKWADNNFAQGDILDAYQIGDALPWGRFTFRYQF